MKTMIKMIIMLVVISRQLSKTGKAVAIAKKKGPTEEEICTTKEIDPQRSLTAEERVATTQEANHMKRVKTGMKTNIPKNLLLHPHQKITKRHLTKEANQQKHLLVQHKVVIIINNLLLKSKDLQMPLRNNRQLLQAARAAHQGFKRKIKTCLHSSLTIINE